MDIKPIVPLEQHLVDAVHKIPHELVGIFLTAGSEMLCYAPQVDHDRLWSDNTPWAGHGTLHVPNHLTHGAEPNSLAVCNVTAPHQCVVERRRVCQALREVSKTQRV